MKLDLLIIEDDPYVQRYYERLFRINNYVVEIASSGKEGIEKAKKLQPKLIFLDIMMPEMNGIEALELLKKDNSTKNLPVIILTNYAEEMTVKKAEELGVADFMVKSASSGEDLLKVVGRYVDRTQERKNARIKER